MRIQLHASCAARDDAGVLLLGPSGCGKSDLMLRLIDRGFLLVADDRVDIEAGMASPPRSLEGLVEMRGLGILKFAYRAPVRLRLACELAAQADPPARLPHPAAHPLGVPLLRVEPHHASAPLLISLALDAIEGRLAMHAGAFA